MQKCGISQADAKSIFASVLLMQKWGLASAKRMAKILLHQFRPMLKYADVNV
jgi:hypothetical protein